MYRKIEAAHFMHGTSAKTANNTYFRTVSWLEITLHEKSTEKILNSAEPKKSLFPHINTV